MGWLMTSELEQFQVDAIVVHIDDYEKNLLDNKLGEWVDYALPPN